MARLWIVDRSPRRRAALARLAAASQDAVLGAPGDPRFESAMPPDVVLLSLDDDWELELQFAFASGRRAAGARWILLGPRGREAEALALFDTRPAEFLVYPPPAHALRAILGSQPLSDATPSLSERARRAAVSERFARWFGDMELPEILRALDPKLAEVSLLVAGEPGTGRGLVARYVHFFGGTGRGTLAHVPCSAELSGRSLAGALAEQAAADPHARALTIWLEEVDQLPATTQRAVLAWIESVPPGAAARPPVVRWVATTTEPGLAGLDPALRLALSGLFVGLTPLRERPHAIPRIVAETARAWCAARQERPRRLGEDALVVLEEYPWPGNLRELEAVVVQSLAQSSSDPLSAEDLQLEGVPLSPLEAGDVGSLLDVEEDESVPPSLGEPSESEIDDLLEQSVPTRGSPASAPSEPKAPTATEEGTLARLVDALSQEVRNPLATIRTFAELLPERFDDPEFRDRFADMVREDVGHIDELVARLTSVANLSRPERTRVDVAALLEELLEARRQRIRSQRLLVLKELDTSQPHALCDPEQLRFALDCLLGKALEWVPTHGDVYLASRHHAASPEKGPSVRVLIRFHEPEDGSRAARPTGNVEGSLELMIAEIVIRAQGGTLSVSSTDGEETVIVIDLPA